MSFEPYAPVATTNPLPVIEGAVTFDDYAPVTATNPLPIVVVAAP